MNAFHNVLQKELRIPEGYFFELYTPIVGKIKSPSLARTLKFAKAYLTADATVTFRDVYGNQSSAVPIAKGPFPCLVTEISVCSQPIYIIHDGWTDSGTDV